MTIQKISSPLVNGVVKPAEGKVLKITNNISEPINNTEINLNYLPSYKHEVNNLITKKDKEGIMTVTDKKNRLISVQNQKKPERSFNNTFIGESVQSKFNDGIVMNYVKGTDKDLISFSNNDKLKATFEFSYNKDIPSKVNIYKYDANNSTYIKYTAENTKSNNPKETFIVSDRLGKGTNKELSQEEIKILKNEIDEILLDCKGRISVALPNFESRFNSAS